MSLRIMPPQEAKRKAREKVLAWRKEKSIAEGRQGKRLFQAIKELNPGICIDAINKGADVDARSYTSDGWYTTPLISAAGNGNTDIIGILIGKGADLEAADLHGKTPLFYACMLGKHDAARILIEHGADVNAADRSGGTPLIDCCRDANLDLAELLIQSGADANAKGIGGETALHAACYVNGDLEIIRLLLHAGADIFARGGPHVDDTPYGTAFKPEFKAVIREYAHSQSDGSLVKLDVIQALLGYRKALDEKGISNVTVFLSVSHEAGAMLDAIEPYQAEEMIAERLGAILRHNKVEYVTCPIVEPIEVQVEFPVRYPYCIFREPQDDKEDDMHGIEDITSG